MEETVTEKPIPVVVLQKPPPIFVNGVEQLKPLKDLLDSIAENEYTLKVLPNNSVKIQPNQSENYVSIVEQLKVKKTQFHKYQQKEEKNYKVVLRNMHPSVDKKELSVAIEEYNHKVVSITNVLQKTTKNPLPLFFVEIKIKENNKKIYEINKLLNLIVSFEPPHKKREIPQCMKCQEFGHTKNYCQKNPVCVKCAKNHLTKDCHIKTRSNEVTCANCEVGPKKFDP